MSNISVNGLVLNDQVNYIVEEITYKNMPKRIINSLPLSTRPGDKLITTEWSTKDIQIKGRVFSATASGILPFIDNLQQNFAVQETAFIADTGRQYTVSLTKLDIPTQFYNASMVQYTADFQASDPFSYGTQLTVSGTTASGIVTFSGTVTISGSVFAQPVLQLIPIGGQSGSSGTYQYQVTYSTTSEYITVSGTNSNTFNYGDIIQIDYNNFDVLLNTVTVDYAGVFARWQPGVVNFTITIPSGVRQAYDWKISYQPRYYE